MAMKAITSYDERVIDHGDGHIDIERFVPSVDIDDYIVLESVWAVVRCNCGTELPSPLAAVLQESLTV